ncbi:putative Transport protein (substrate arsenite) [groundwater metagenome]|uniref:Putative Transport protein (Substrate arsenite) n=1 Tax=groundwater metagenome TaxID=717931 RepID=A0A098ECT4_9ZZZZ
MVNKILKSVTDNLIYLILGSILLGLLIGQYVGSDVKSVLNMLVLPVLFFMIYPMMINIKIEEFFNAFKDTRPVLLSLFINFVVSPLLAIGIANVFFSGDPIYAVGLYLIALLPTSGMTAAWTGLAKGNLNTSLVLISVNLLLSVLILPIYLKFLIPAGVPFDLVVLFKDLLTIVIIPMIAGDLTQRFIIKKYGKEKFMELKPNFSGLSSIGVLMVVFIAICMKSTSILSDVVASAMIIIPLILFYGLMLGTSILIGKYLLERGKAIALTYSTGMRDLSVAIAVAMLSFPKAVLLIVLCYMIQPPVAALYMKYLRGKNKEN